jgi:glutathione S-transferase
MPNITLYGTPASTYVRTTRLLLAEANIDYDLKDIGIFNGDNKTQSYLSKHPFGKVPTLEIDGQTIYETAAITYYLNQKLAGGKFSPPDLLMQTRMHQRLYLGDLLTGLSTIFLLTLPRLPKLEEISLPQGLTVLVTRVI